MNVRDSLSRLGTLHPVRDLRRSLVDEAMEVVRTVFQENSDRLVNEVTRRISRDIETHIRKLPVEVAVDLEQRMEARGKALGGMTESEAKSIREQADNRIMESRAEVMQLEAEAFRLRNELEKANKTISEKIENLSKANAELKQLKFSQVDLEGRNRVLQNQLSTLEMQLKQSRLVEEELARVKTQTENHIAARRKADSERDRQRSRSDKAEAEVARLRIELEAMRTERATLLEQKTIKETKAVTSSPSRRKRSDGKPKKVAAEVIPVSSLPEVDTATSAKRKRSTRRQTEEAVS